MNTVLTFSEDNPQAALWFSLLQQGVSLAAPGARSSKVKAVECRVLDKLDAISDPVGEPAANGYQPRRLREPCAVAFDDDERALVITYLAGAGFQPYLSRSVRDLLATLTAPATPESNDR